MPRALVWDNESGVGRYGGANPRLTPQFAALRGMLGCKVIVLRPRDPQAKGLVERANGYLETSFLPGRRFTSVVDFDTQLAEWIGRVNTRPRRALDGAAPADRVGVDRQAMGPLPAIDTASIGWRHTVRLGRDHYVRLDTCDYSVHPAAVGHRVDVTADLATVRIMRDGVLVGSHERCWARHQTLTDPAHAKAAAAMRQAYRLPRPRPADTEVACRDLADYDRLFDTGPKLTGADTTTLPEVA